MDKVCGNCTHYIGGGDWDLCCTIRHPTPSEQKAGVAYPFGHLCYEDTPACDVFNQRSEQGEEKVNNQG